MSKRKYIIVFAPSVLRRLRKLSADDQRRIMRAIEMLKQDPRPSGTKKLQGADNLWRIRVGGYRVVYEIQNAVLTVLVLRVAHRKDAYREGK